MMTKTTGESVSMQSMPSFSSALSSILLFTIVCLLSFSSSNPSLLLVKNPVRQHSEVNQCGTCFFPISVEHFKLQKATLSWIMLGKISK